MADEGRNMQNDAMEAPGTSESIPTNQNGDAEGSTQEAVDDLVKEKKPSIYEEAVYSAMNPRIVKLLKQRFKEMDSDHNNQLDYQEFCYAFSLDDNAISTQLFNIYDTDKSGFIDVEEFITELTNRVKPGKDAARRIFELADLNGNGYIEKEELVEILLAANAYKKVKPTKEHIEEMVTNMMKDVCTHKPKKKSLGQRLAGLFCFFMGEREKRKVAHEVEEPVYHLNEKKFLKLCKKHEEIIFPLNRVIEKETNMARLFGFDMFTPLFRKTSSWTQKTSINEHRAGVGINSNTFDQVPDLDGQSTADPEASKPQWNILPQPIVNIAAKTRRRRSVIR